MLLKPAKNFTKESHIYIRLAKFHTPIAENATSEATYSYEIVANTHGFDNCKLLLSVVREKRSFQGNLIKGQGILWKLSGTKIFTGVKLPRILVSSFAILNFKRRRKVNVLDLGFFWRCLVQQNKWKMSHVKLVFDWTHQEKIITIFGIIISCIDSIL